MKIYIVHEDALEGKKHFPEFTDEEVVALSKEVPEYVDVYDNVEHFAHAWNNEDIFYPSSSYIRFIID